MASYQAAQSCEADATEPHRVLAYRSDIDGLRAVAVLGVLLFHAFADLLPGGFWGVDVFFVVSGFLISRIIWDGIWSSRFSAREFYGRRIRGIFPPLAMVLLATWTAAYSMLSWDEIKSKAPHARVVILGPEIRWEPSLPKVLISFIEESKQMPPNYLSPPLGWFVSEARRVEEPVRPLAKEKGATHTLPHGIICQSERCLTWFGERQEDLMIFN